MWWWRETRVSLCGSELHRDTDRERRKRKRKGEKKKKTTQSAYVCWLTIRLLSFCPHPSLTPPMCSCCCETNKSRMYACIESEDYCREKTREGREGEGGRGEGLQCVCVCVCVCE